MKSQLIILSLTICNLAFSQVVIGEPNAAPSSSSALLEFSPNDGTAKKGIILPIVKLTDMNTTVADGTFAMDYDSKIIKVYQDGQWIDLTDEGAFDEQLDGTTPISTAAQINTSDDVGDGVIIGNTASTAEGVLVLEATDKALILPKVYKPELNIKSPVAGTMCYDTASDSLAIFDGKVWSYWKQSSL